MKISVVRRSKMADSGFLSRRYLRDKGACPLTINLLIPYSFYYRMDP